LNEGLATLFQYGLRKGKTLDARVIPVERLKFLQKIIKSGNTISLSRLMGSSQSEWIRAGAKEEYVYYCESWMLVYFLAYASKGKYQNALNKYIMLLHGGKSPLKSRIEAFGEGFYYAREINKQIPNGVISRWPIIDAGYWNDTRVSNREFVWAQIDLPGTVDLWAVSVHFLTTSSGDRASEALQVVNYVSQNIPDGDYLVIGGDLNTNSETEQAVEFRICILDLLCNHPVHRLAHHGDELRELSTLVGVTKSEIGEHGQCCATDIVTVESVTVLLITAIGTQEAIG